MLGRDVLDIYPRRVVLFPRTGRVLCKRLPAADAPQAEQQDASYRSQLAKPRGGDMELFR